MAEWIAKIAITGTIQVTVTAGTEADAEAMIEAGEWSDEVLIERDPGEVLKLELAPAEAERHAE